MMYFGPGRPCRTEGCRTIIGGCSNLCSKCDGFYARIRELDPEFWGPNSEEREKEYQEYEAHHSTEYACWDECKYCKWQDDHYAPCAACKREDASVSSDRARRAEQIRNWGGRVLCWNCRPFFHVFRPADSDDGNEYLESVVFPGHSWWNSVPVEEGTDGIFKSLNESVSKGYISQEDVEQMVWCVGFGHTPERRKTTWN